MPIGLNSLKRDRVTDEAGSPRNVSDAELAGVRRGERPRARAERDSLARVLNLVRSGMAGTRQELEAYSGLGRAVVADRVATLTALGLVDEGELGPSTGGRAPRQVRFRADAGHVLTASVGTTTLGVGIADLSGKLVVEHHEVGDVSLGAENTLDRVEALFDWMIGEHAEGRPIWGIGVALPGLVEHDGGRLSSAPTPRMLPGWDDHPVVPRLARFNVPVWLDSEVHFMALGELRFGRGVGSDDLLFLKLGSGISVGLCAEGRVHRGAHGFAGDIGHVAVDDGSAVICRCGNTGCLEALAGSAAIAREGQRAAAAGTSPLLGNVLSTGRAVTAADVGMAARRGDPFSIELLARVGALVGATIATLVNAYNPSLVVVGGGVAQAGEILLAAVRESVYRKSRSMATRDLQIVRSEMGKTGGLIGAALAVADEVFAEEFFETWIDRGSPVRARDASPRAAAHPTAAQPARLTRPPNPTQPAHQGPLRPVGKRQ